jgi:hypothetical protein
LKEFVVVIFNPIFSRLFYQGELEKAVKMLQRLSLQQKENNRVRGEEQKVYFVKRLQLAVTGITSLLQFQLKYCYLTKDVAFL